MTEYNIEEHLKGCDDKFLLFLKKSINKEIKKRKNEKIQKKKSFKFQYSN